MSSIASSTVAKGARVSTAVVIPAIVPPGPFASVAPRLPACEPDDDAEEEEGVVDPERGPGPLPLLLPQLLRAGVGASLPGEAVAPEAEDEHHDDADERDQAEDPPEPDPVAERPDPAEQKAAPVELLELLLDADRLGTSRLECDVAHANSPFGDGVVTSE